MYVLDQLSVAPNRRLWTLVDTTTNLPLLFPLLFLIDRLASRSESTQSSTLQALKFFYEYWYQKHDVTFCLSFQLSGYNPSIAACQNSMPGVFFLSELIFPMSDVLPLTPQRMNFFH